MIITRAAAAAAAALFGAVALWHLATRAGEDGPMADADDPALVAIGETVYAAHCAACHGAELEGEPDWQSPGPDGRFPAPPHDATGHTWHHPDTMLFTITRDGIAAIVPGYESNMPAFGAILSDEEIWAVLAFIKSRWPDDIRRLHERVNGAAAEREQPLPTN